MNIIHIKEVHMRLDIYNVTIMPKKDGIKINYSRIAKQYGCDYRTVKRYFESDSTVVKERKKRKIKKLLDGYEEIIKEKYIKYHSPAIAIYDLLKNKYNYKGSYQTITNYTSKLKNDLENEATIRFETNPGLQCQIDWKENLSLVNKNGEMLVINIFLSILGYSRLKYIELTLDKQQPTLFKCLTNMFKYFNGVPKELLFDNMKTVVDQSRTQFGEPVYNDTFVKFAQDANFTPKSCIAYRPKTKGKVETVAKIMNRLKVYNNEFDTLDDLNKIVKDLMKSINEEIQATTQEKPIERFEKEKEYLFHNINFDMLSNYYSDSPIQRKVSKEGLITFGGKRYSVSPKYNNKYVIIKYDNNYLYIYYNSLLIKKHQISEKTINYDKNDYFEIIKTTISNDDRVEEICKKNLEAFDLL